MPGSGIHVYSSIILRMLLCEVYCTMDHRCLRYSHTHCCKGHANHTITNTTIPGAEGFLLLLRSAEGSSQLIAIIFLADRYAVVANAVAQGQSLMTEC